MLRGIHKLCDKGSWGEARSLLNDSGPNGETAREAASQPGGYGEWTPLHLACKRDPPPDIIEKICIVSKVSAETFDLYNRLPIHYATEHGVSLSVMKILIEACPDSVTGLNDEGLTPLQNCFKYANINTETLDEPVRCFPTVGEVSLLLGEDSVVAWSTDENGNIPLHLAVSNIDACTVDILNVLVSKDINCVAAQNNNGMTPIHVALSKCVEHPISTEVVNILLGISQIGEELIVEEYEVTRILDNGNMLPLHFACKNFEHVPLDVFDVILNRCPDAASTEALDYGYPLDILERNRNTITSLEEKSHLNRISDMLFAYYPDLLPYRTEHDRLERIGRYIREEVSEKKFPLSDIYKSLWIWMSTYSELDDPESIYPNKVKEILEGIHDEESCKLLASLETTTEDGLIMPLHELSSTITRSILLPYLRFVDRYEIKECSASRRFSDDCVVFRAIDSIAKIKTHQNVIIKFYRDKRRFLREVGIQNILCSYTDGNDLGPPVVPMIQFFNIDNIGKSEETPEDVKFSKHVNQSYYGGEIDISRFRYAIVFIEADEDDNDHLLGENNNIYDRTQHNDLKKYLMEIGESIHCLHMNNIFLGEVKPTSFTKFDGYYQSLKDISTVFSLSEDVSTYFGSISQNFRVCSLSPEMIAKLGSEEVARYLLYWDDVARDANIVQNLTTDDLLYQTEKVKSLIDAEGVSFETFWDRANRNYRLWKKIKPRKCGNDYFVIKCFRTNSLDGTPYCKDDLPYSLISASENLDIWSYGSLMFEIYTGETLFHSNKEGIIINNVDFNILYNLTESSCIESRLKSVEDPLARDLLRSILNSPLLERKSSMQSILEHPFFNVQVDPNVYNIIDKILLQEQNNDREKRFLQDEKSIKEEEEKKLCYRTDKILTVPLKTQLNFEYSTWRQLKSPYALDEVIFPTCCVVLPYKLEEKNNILTVPENDFVLATSLGLALADVLHYSSFVSNMTQHWLQSSEFKLQEYIDMNKVSITEPEDCLIQNCRGIITRSKNAETILKDILAPFFTEELSLGVAKKLISDTLKDIVDLHLCERVIQNVDIAQKAVSSLLHVVRDYPKEDISRFLSIQMNDLVGTEFVESSFEKSEEAQIALSSLIKDFSDDALTASNALLELKIDDLVEIYYASNNCFLYLVDECLDRPLISGVYPITISFNSDVVRTFIPLTVLAVKRHFPLGIGSLLGLNRDVYPQEWSSINNCYVEYFNEVSNELEFGVRQNVLDSHPSLEENTEVTNISARDDLLHRLSDFFIKYDAKEDFSCLRRLCSPNELILWTTENGRDIVREQSRIELEEFKNKEINRGRKEITNLTEVMSESQNRCLNNLWCKDSALSPIFVPVPEPFILPSNQHFSDFSIHNKNSQFKKKSSLSKRLKGWKPFRVEIKHGFENDMNKASIYKTLKKQVVEVKSIGKTYVENIRDQIIFQEPKENITTTFVNNHEYKKEHEEIFSNIHDDNMRSGSRTLEKGLMKRFIPRKLCNTQSDVNKQDKLKPENKKENLSISKGSCFDSTLLADSERISNFIKRPSRGIVRIAKREDMESVSEDSLQRGRTRQGIGRVQSRGGQRSISRMQSVSMRSGHMPISRGRSRTPLSNNGLSSQKHRPRTLSESRCRKLGSVDCKKSISSPYVPFQIRSCNGRQHSDRSFDMKSVVSDSGGNNNTIDPISLSKIISS